MISRNFASRMVCSFAFSLTVIAAASAQHLDVYAHNKIAIEEDAQYTSTLNGTHFGNVVAGQTKSSGPIWIENSYNSTMRVESITISGSDKFTVSYFPTTLQPGSVMSAYITAAPTTSIWDSASVQITTNLPGNDATYTFPISCAGIDSAATDTSDIFYLSTVKPPKYKTNKKTGEMSVQMSETAGNSGPANCDGGVVVHYFSSTRLLYLSHYGPELTQGLKPIPVPLPGKKPKLAKIKTKMGLPLAEGYIFSIVGPYFDYQDPDWSNNVIRKTVGI